MSAVFHQAEARGEFGQQALVGVSLAFAIMLAWLATHIFAVFFQGWTAAGWLAAPLLIALLSWLNVGLFIVAHDCMHGSLAPFRPGLNRWVGRIALFLYAGFSFDRLIGKHFAHHRHAGTALDPDFSEDHPDRFWPWYFGFMREYFGFREFAVLTVIGAIYLAVLGASLVNVLAFWALPALLSSLQLFFFGTYLPHRRGEEPFDDGHQARSSEYPWLVSLLTCFHFGYHHEHHAKPHVPWWKLPEARRISSA